MTAEERQKRMDELSIYIKEKDEMLSKILEYMKANPPMTEKERSNAYLIYNFHYTLWKHAFNELRQL